MADYTKTPFINKVVYFIPEVLCAGFSALNEAKAKRYRAEMAAKAASLATQVEEHRVFEKTYPGKIKVRVSEFVILGIVGDLLTVKADRHAWVNGDVEGAMDAFYEHYFLRHSQSEDIVARPSADPIPAFVLDCGRILTDKNGDVLYFRTSKAAHEAARRYHERFSLRCEAVFTYVYEEVNFVEDRQAKAEEVRDPCYFLYAESLPDGERVLTDKNGAPLFFRSVELAFAAGNRYAWEFGVAVRPVSTHVSSKARAQFVEDRL